MTRSGRSSCRRAVATRMPTDTIAIASSAKGALPYGYLSISDTRGVRFLTPARRAFLALAVARPDEVRHHACFRSGAMNTNNGVWLVGAAVVALAGCGSSP